MTSTQPSNREKLGLEPSGFRVVMQLIQSKPKAERSLRGPRTAKATFTYLTLTSPKGA
jgi:hypothetical protein